MEQPTTRRRFLAVLGTGSVIGGCASRPATDSDPPEVSDSTASPTAVRPNCGTPGEQTTAAASPSDGFPKVGVSSSDPPTTAQVRQMATVTRPFTAESPARVRFRFTNTAPDPRVFWFGGVVPFTPASVTHETDTARLQLVPVRSGAAGVDTNDDGEFTVVPDTPQGGCWQAVDEVIYPDVRQFVELDPCESAAASFEAVAHPDNDRCLPGGQYVTRDEWTTANEPRSTAQDVSFTWRVVVSLS